MWLRMSLCCVFFFSTVAQPQSVISQENISKLLEEVMQKQREMNKQITEYTAMNRQRTRFFDDKGKVKEEVVLVSESYQSSERNVEVVLSKNGKPYAAGKIAKERQEAVKALTADELQRINAEQTNPNRRGPEFGLNYGQDKNRTVRLSTFDIFRACQFTNPRQTEWKGRAVIALDFQPDPKFSPTDRRLTPLQHLAGTVWIDAADKITAKVNAFLAGDAARQDPAFAVEYVRLTDGMWLIASARLNTAGNPVYFNDVRVDWAWEKTNYQRFTAQAGEAKITVPKQ